MSIFNKIAKNSRPKSTFNLSHDRKFSMPMGKLIPTLCQEVLPGDEWNVSTQQMMRLAPMVNPMMHDVTVTNHFFYVPNRILWDNWEDFIRGGDDGLDQSLLPQVINLNVKAGDLGDYLGLPILEAYEKPISILPYLAYNKIWNEYYRDQNLQDEIPNPFVHKESQDDANWFEQGVKDMIDYENVNADFFKLKSRAWGHDYFTSCLPEAQKGNPVRLPLINTASSYLDVEFDRDASQTMIVKQSNGLPSTDGSGLTAPIGTGSIVTDGSGDRMAVNNAGQLKVPLNSLDTAAALLNDVRTAFSIQKWYELANRGGSRFREFLYNFFGVNYDDARLQVPEWLGGGVSPIMVSEVLQTSETANSPQGNMAGHGINLGSQHSFKRFFKEHGIIMCITSVMPKTAYQQGIPRFWLKSDKFDYAFTEFEHIGEQTVFTEELYASNDIPEKKEFGYQERFAEYKYISNSVHGDFKTNMNDWHMGRIFENEPVLNEEFIKSDPTTRVFAVTDEPNVLWCQMWHNIRAKRQMSYWSTPGMTKL